MTSLLQIVGVIALTSLIVGGSTGAMIWLFSRP